MFDSRSLTDTERRYAQFEREALGIVWGVEHFHLYLLGIHFEIRTDHKPLIHSYAPNGNPPCTCPKVCFAVTTLLYTIKHVDGKTNVAEDYLSRSPLPIEQKEEICYQNTEEYIQSVVLRAILSALTVRHVELVSSNDTELEICLREW